MMSRSKIQFLIVSLLVLGLVVEVILLGLQNQRLKQSLEKTLNQPAEAAIELSAGDVLPALDMLDLDGANERLTFADVEPNRVLFVFNTRCPACEETRPAWQRLAAALGGSLEVLGLASDSIEEVAAYASEHHLSFPVYAFANQESIRSLNVRRVPQTILLAGNGTVIGRWSGPIPAEQVAWIERVVSHKGKSQAESSVQSSLKLPGRSNLAARAESRAALRAALFRHLCVAKFAKYPSMTVVSRRRPGGAQSWRSLAKNCSLSHAPDFHHGLLAPAAPSGAATPGVG